MGVHPLHAMAGIEEPVEQHEVLAMRVGQPFQRRPGSGADRLDQIRVRLAVRLGLDIAGEPVDRITDTGRPLPAGSASRNEAGG
jgi:hypothetical protein